VWALIAGSTCAGVADAFILKLGSASTWQGQENVSSNQLGQILQVARASLHFVLPAIPS